MSLFFFMLEAFLRCVGILYLLFMLRIRYQKYYQKFLCMDFVWIKQNAFATVGLYSR